MSAPRSGRFCSIARSTRLAARAQRGGTGPGPGHRDSCWPAGRVESRPGPRSAPARSPAGRSARWPWRRRRGRRVSSRLVKTAGVAGGVGGRRVHGGGGWGDAACLEPAGPGERRMVEPGAAAIAARLCRLRRTTGWRGPSPVAGPLASGEALLEAAERVAERERCADIVAGHGPKL